MSDTVTADIKRKKTRAVKIGDLTIGAGHEIPVQSMIKIPTARKEEIVDEIKELEEAGCKIIRVTANDSEAAKALQYIKQNISIPLVADIHFDYELALEAIKSGVDKVRLNPGNIRRRGKHLDDEGFNNEKEIEAVVEAAQAAKIPIRIGVNSGSLEKDILKKHQYPTSDALVESALRHIKILENFEFYDIIVALKSSQVWTTIEAYRKISEKVDYPLHLGVTEAGGALPGLVKSSIGIGTLLAEGIGDTLRVSLTGPAIEEVKSGNEILKSLGYRSFGVNLISCPTCGRLQADLVSIIEELQEPLSKIKTPLNIAVMGCVVNGPGESKGADIGVSLGKNHAIFYVNGLSRGEISVGEVKEKILAAVEELS